MLVTEGFVSAKHTTTRDATTGRVYEVENNKKIRIQRKKKKTESQYRTRDQSRWNLITVPTRTDHGFGIRAR
jgi:hypothetical protein